jgi:hypothetical protein
LPEPGQQTVDARRHVACDGAEENAPHAADPVLGWLVLLYAQQQTQLLDQPRALLVVLERADQRLDPRALGIAGRRRRRRGPGGAAQPRQQDRDQQHDARQRPRRESDRAHHPPRASHSSTCQSRSAPQKPSPSTTT